MLVYLSLGSNLEPRLEYLDRAVTALESLGQIKQLSPIYETEPLGPGKQAWHLNQAVALETALEPDELLASCKQIEQALGRQDRGKWATREIDIDILLVHGRVLDAPHLVVPHPELAKRRFVLQPLSDIAADVVVPPDNLTVRLLLQNCQDTLQVKPYEPRGHHPTD